MVFSVDKDFWPNGVCPPKCHRKDGICASGICPCSFWPLFLGNVMMKQWILAGYTSLFHKLTDKMRVSSISSIKRDVIGKKMILSTVISGMRSTLTKKSMGWVRKSGSKTKTTPDSSNLCFEAIHCLISSATVGNPAANNRITISNGQMGGWIKINRPVS